MLRGVLRKYRTFREWKRIVWDSDCESTISLPEKIKYAKKGFSVEEYIYYDLKRNDYKDYISEYDRLRSREINGAYKFILDDKLAFEEVVGKYVKVPENYAWISDGIVYGLHDNGANNDNIIDYLKKYQKSVLKWNGRGGGFGTYVISFEDGNMFVNGKQETEENVENLFKRKGDAILCEYITQSEFASSLYPYTTNTIRIVCAKKKGDREAKFITAIQRVGTKKSIPVDNLCSGGFTLEIDPETGALSEGMAICGDKDHVLKPFKVHPDSGSELAGRRIPNWTEIKNQMVDITNKIPYLNFVAWDILLTDDGFCVIEGNASSGVAIFQMHNGVKKSELGDIYRSYNVF
ncbi:sugar-transfer associated ATP-grasp domain-containing protein [Butyrivibrio sp. YAB3001]|uniref:sugar-transfer associated ATP-grasp domain-containing protein n=1 Tax=Butyrivibrio sp. YAB3001 TaxID=1520812 RepID=UPI0008F630B2|nr:sugar-transfer associated ATP-grasp domain-containing protein [Butyrivibrio sp. YAB3001]SFC62231.1 Sugar-transfer associated ATP-grasp [Butyrivibrio sp. YAB3001]